jgi:hypothetical protein
MNLSAPKGKSFNEAIDPFDCGKLLMSSAKGFGDALKKFGKGAEFMKQDIENAYKLIPNAKSQRRMYGMKWLGKYWYDSSTVFGSGAAPATFDPLRPRW